MSSYSTMLRRLAPLPNKASLGAALISRLRRLWVHGFQAFLVSFLGDTMDDILCIMSMGSVGCKGAGMRSSLQISCMLLAAVWLLA